MDGGSIVIDGNDITGLPDYKRAPFIGRVFQDPMMGTAPDMQLEENLALPTGAEKSSGFAGTSTARSATCTASGCAS